MRRFLAVILCFLMMMSLIGCGQSREVEAENVIETEESTTDSTTESPEEIIVESAADNIEDKPVIEIKTVIQNGVECYKAGGVCYPAVFGEPQLTDEEITALFECGDPLEIALTVNTLPDCLRLLKARQMHNENIDNVDAETTILRGGNQPRGWVEAMTYLLNGDYEDSGRIDLFADDNYYAFAAVKQEGQYFAFDPFTISGFNWLENMPEGEYAAADVQVLTDTLVKNCNYSPFTGGKYVAKTEKLPDRETMERQQLFKHREYTDAEIQQMATSGLTLEEAADKLHTAEDAALFLQANGYHFDFSYNQSTFIDGYDWCWVLPADFTYEHMAGSCGGTSNLMNRLLSGDYEEQGYVEYLGAHIFNYIKQDGYYYFCDFMNCKYLNSEHSKSDYLMYVCKNPYDFVEYYCNNVFPEWDNPEAEDDYLVYMYLYPRDGKDALAMGTSGKNNYLGGGRNRDFACSEIKDTMIQLYMRDGFTITFVDFDSEANRPPVKNIPRDE